MSEAIGVEVAPAEIASVETPIERNKSKYDRAIVDGPLAAPSGR
jgi:hypothetical protein